MADTPAIISYAKYRLEQRDADAFKALAIRMADQATSNEGALFLNVLQDVRDSMTFRLVEGWPDQATLDKHGGNPAFHAMLAEAQKLAIVEFSADVYGIASAQPAVKPST